MISASLMGKSLKKILSSQHKLLTNIHWTERNWKGSSTIKLNPFFSKKVLQIQGNPGAETVGDTENFPFPINYYQAWNYIDL